MATLRQQVQRLWGWEYTDVCESMEGKEYSRGDFLSFVSRTTTYFGPTWKYVLILGIKKRSAWGLYNDPGDPEYEYIAKISDYTKPSENSNHRIITLNRDMLEKCTYKSSIKRILSKL